MRAFIRFAKWSVVPAVVVLAQITCNATGAFSSEPLIWGFIAAALVILLVWRHRLGKKVASIKPDGIPEMKQLGRADRRFLFCSLLFPLVSLFVLELLVLVAITLDVPVAQRHSGTLWTIFGIIAVGFQQIAACVGYLIVTRSTRGSQILSACSSRPSTQ